MVVRNGLARDADAVNSLTLRNQVSPLADWLDVDIGGTSLSGWESRLRQELSAALGRKHMDFSQLVLMGWRDAARAALDLILKGAITCAGIVAVDVPCALPPAADRRRRPPASASSGMTTEADEEAGLIDALRRQDADIRLMNLPAGGRHARDVTTRATAAFLSELTAKACLQSSASKGASHV